MNDARHDPAAAGIRVDFDAAAALHWEAERPLMLGEWMEDIQARLAALEARGLTVSRILDKRGLTVFPNSSAPAAADTEPDADLRNWAAPPGALAGRPGGTLYALTPWPEGVDKRLARGEMDAAQLRDALDYLTRRVDALEAAIAALRGTVGAHDETLQAITLRGDDGR